MVLGGTINTATNILSYSIGIGSSIGCIGSTTTTTGTNINLNNYYEKEVKDVIVTEETIEIIYVQRAKFMYTTTLTLYSNNSCDRTYKEIYGSRDGKLTLLKTVQGVIVPPKTIGESYEFKD